MQFQQNILRMGCTYSDIQADFTSPTCSSRSNFIYLSWPRMTYLKMSCSGFGLFIRNYCRMGPWMACCRWCQGSPSPSPPSQGMRVWSVHLKWGFPLWHHRPQRLCHQSSNSITFRKGNSTWFHVFFPLMYLMCGTGTRVLKWRINDQWICIMPGLMPLQPPIFWRCDGIIDAKLPPKTKNKQKKKHTTRRGSEFIEVQPTNLRDTSKLTGLQ